MKEKTKKEKQGHARLFELAGAHFIGRTRSVLPEFRLSGTRIRPSEFVRLGFNGERAAFSPSSAPAELVSAPAELVYIECNGRTRSVLPEFRLSGTRIRPAELVCLDFNGEREAFSPSSAPAELVYICRPASRQAPPADARIPRLRPARLRCGGKTAARPSRGRRRPGRRAASAARGGRIPVKAVFCSFLTIV